MVGKRLMGVACMAVLVLVPATASAEAEHGLRERGAVLCHTPAQTITERHGISCKGAVWVADASMQDGLRWPECPGDHSRRWHGWTVSAHPKAGEPGHPVIGTRFRKGEKSFVAEGGGLC